MLADLLVHVAMQVAAMSPKFLTTDDISDEYKAQELETLKAQAKNDPKNASKYTFPVGLEDDLKIEEKGKKA